MTLHHVFSPVYCPCWGVGRALTLQGTPQPFLNQIYPKTSMKTHMKIRKKTHNRTIYISDLLPVITCFVTDYQNKITFVTTYIFLQKLRLFITIVKKNMRLNTLPFS